jgi:hypothetical protein
MTSEPLSTISYSISNDLYSTPLLKPYEIKTNDKATQLEITGPLMVDKKNPPNKSGSMIRCAGNASDYFMMIQNKLCKFINVMSAYTWNNNYFSSDTYDCSSIVKEDTIMDSISNNTTQNEVIRCSKDYINNTIQYYKVIMDNNNTLIMPTESVSNAKLYNCDSFEDSETYYTNKLLTNVSKNYNNDSTCNGATILYKGVNYCFPYVVENNIPILYDVRDIFNGDKGVIDSGSYFITGISIDGNGARESFNLIGKSIIDNLDIKILQVYTNTDKSMLTMV